jgi:AcrR family transcriptional regulator
MKPAGLRARSAIQRFRREEIETAALRTVLRRGFPATSLRTVAKEAGLPLGVIHYYFKNRDDLMRRVASRIYNTMIAEMKAVRARYRDPTRRIDALLETWLVGATEDWRASLAYIEYWASCVRAGTVDRLYSRMLAGFRAMLAETLADAGARDAHETSLRVLAVLSGYAMFYRTKPADPDERERILNFAREIARRTIARGRSTMRVIARGKSARE